MSNESRVIIAKNEQHDSLYLYIRISVGVVSCLLEGHLHHPPESSVAVGTNQLLAPPDTEPLHFTRFVVYTQ